LIEVAVVSDFGESFSDSAFGDRFKFEFHSALRTTRV
jgi:hypothetical protein